MKPSGPKTVHRRKRRDVIRPLLKLDKIGPNDCPCREPKK